MRMLLLPLFLLLFGPSSDAVVFGHWFKEATLRIDLSAVVAGDGAGVEIDSMLVTKGWGGRHVNLDTMPSRNIFEYALIDEKTGKTLFRDSKYMPIYNQTKDYPLKNYITVPLPKRDAILTTVGLSASGDTLLESSMRLRRDSVARFAVRQQAVSFPRTVLNKAKWKNAVNLLIVAEGYTKGEMGDFRRHAQTFVDTLFAQEAFAKYRDRFNITALETPSDESGVSRPSKDIFKDTAFGSAYDSYSMDRLLTVTDVRNIADMTAGAPATRIIILANSRMYGGSGPYNEYSIGYTGEEWSAGVLVHEFAHCFADLNDEYPGGYLNIESSKLKTQNSPHRCLMHAIPDRVFCPACTQAIERCIMLYTEQRKR